MTPTTHARDIYVEANGLRHHLIARGSPGQPIVMLIHGLSQQAHVFDEAATALSNDFHVYALDVRGRGETEWGTADGYHFTNYVEDLEAVREALGLERLSLVGTSMGGLIAMYYAASHGVRVRRLVMNDIGPEIAPEGLKRVLEITSSAPSAFTDLKAVAKYYKDVHPEVLAGRSTDETLEYARWHVRRSDSGLYVWKMDPAVRQPPATPPPPPMEPWAALKAVNCPVLVIRGSESDILTEEICGRMEAALADSKSAVVPGVGHAPTLSEPEAYQALHDFLAG